MAWPPSAHLIVKQHFIHMDCTQFSLAWVSPSAEPGNSTRLGGLLWGLNVMCRSQHHLPQACLSPSQNTMFRGVSELVSESEDFPLEGKCPKVNMKIGQAYCLAGRTRIELSS